MIYRDTMPGRLENHVDVVTGVGNGTGRATVPRFVAEGAACCQPGAAGSMQVVGVDRGSTGEPTTPTSRE